MTPAVSICMPVFNGARFLPSAFESLSQQTFRDFEVVMVDDGSSDGSADLAMALMRKFELAGQVIRGVNRGAEQARDASCLAASGELIAPFDCDDTWMPTYLEEMVSALDKDPAIGLIYCDFDEEFTDTGRVVRKSSTTPWIDKAKAVNVSERLYRFDDGTFFSMLLLGGVLFPPCTVFRRQVYDAAGGYSPVNPRQKPKPWFADERDTNKNVSLDWCFGLRVSRLASVAFLDRPLLRKTRHPGNWSGNATWTAKCDVRVLRAVLQDPSLSKTDQAAARMRLATRALDAGYGDWRFSNNPREARQWLLESFWSRPSMSTLAVAAATLIPTPVAASIRSVKRTLRASQSTSAKPS